MQVLTLRLSTLPTPALLVSFLPPNSVSPPLRLLSCHTGLARPRWMPPERPGLGTHFRTAAAAAAAAEPATPAAVVGLEDSPRELLREQGALLVFRPATAAGRGRPVPAERLLENGQRWMLSSAAVVVGVLVVAVVGDLLSFLSVGFFSPGLKMSLHFLRGGGGAGGSSGRAAGAGGGGGIEGAEWDIGAGGRIRRGSSTPLANSSSAVRRGGCGSEDGGFSSSRTRTQGRRRRCSAASAILLQSPWKGVGIRKVEGMEDSRAAKRRNA
ncbi:hypothetical protein HPP92_025258 [Vanilla planifolia]|uniref:Uncharacterized protein n=1 Tax=Vanilla planifolia TaxID=51239 RepID=A0A835PIT9_VANPL|nr:hypothetical protein HPP92_025258 [Vanilla planifolia]